VNDIILVTVDSWRYDAPNAMPRFSEMTDEWNSGYLICVASATNGAFPAILSSQFYPELYQNNGSVPEDTASLPTLLSDRGYSTGGFVASNPSLGKWSEHFDAWWNDGMSATGFDSNLAKRDLTVPGKLARLLALRPRIPAEDVLSRADEWWTRTDSPRFLWVHLMEPHEPYVPGFNLGREVGLFRSYASTVGHAKLRQNVPAWMKQHLKRLHYQTYVRLDRVLTPWLKAHDDATIVLTGDHGEEFDHGLIKHARLYDETVRVPLVSNDLFNSLSEEELVRQLDLAPSIVSELDISVPDTWEGTPSTDTPQPQEMINSSPEFERSWVGVRSKSWKIMFTYDWSDGFRGSETYNIEADPEESDPKSVLAAPSSLRERLSEFIDRPAISKKISSESELKTGINSEVEGRLKRLGYMN